MKDALKSIIKNVEKELEQYAQEMASGKQMTEKDPERLSKLIKIVRDGKIICAISEITEKSDEAAGGSMGKLMGGLGGLFGGQNKQQGFGQQGQGMGFGQGGYGNQQGGGFGMPSMRLGFGNDLSEPTNLYPGPMYSPQSHWEDDPEMRRGRSRKTGRYIHRSEYDGDMNNHYDDDTEDRQGRSGSSSSTQSGSGGSTQTGNGSILR